MKRRSISLFVKIGLLLILGIVLAGAAMAFSSVSPTEIFINGQQINLLPQLIPLESMLH